MSSFSKKYLKKSNILFPLENFSQIDDKIKIIDHKRLKKITYSDKKNQKHNGVILAKYKKFRIIDCFLCKFIHAIPYVNTLYVENLYKKKFYKQKRKENYFYNQKKDKIWWNQIFKQRIDTFEKILKKKGIIVDIGCGPGFFLKFAKNKGWKTYGIEPSQDAVDFGKNYLGVKIINGNYNLLKNFKNIDVIYTHGVLEHLEDPSDFFDLAKKSLSKNGIIFTSVANDFNQIQSIALSITKKPWWIIPPEHYNYFSVSSITGLIKQKFKIVDIKVSFPLDFFILMGQNYIKNKYLGKIVHKMRVNFEKNLEKNGFSKLKGEILDAYANLKIGRQIDIICKNKNN